LLGAKLLCKALCAKPNFCKIKTKDTVPYKEHRVRQRNYLLLLK